MSEQDNAADRGRDAGVWFRTEPQRRKRPPLSQERIVEGAVALLDEEGLSELSTRKLAARLESGATSIYWHVASMDDVLDLALDEVLGEVELPVHHAERWREDLWRFMSGLRRVILRHPWSATLFGARPLMGPNALAHSEFIYAALVKAGFTGAKLSAVAATIFDHVVGHAVAEASWLGVDETEARGLARSRLQDQREHYPTLAEYAYNQDEDWGTHFSLGAQFLLDGLDAQQDR